MIRSTYRTRPRWDSRGRGVQKVEAVTDDTRIELQIVERHHMHHVRFHQSTVVLPDGRALIMPASWDGKYFEVLGRGEL